MLCKLTYALTADGRAIHISEAERGLGCGCVCAGCGEPLIARQGDEMGHHFAHAGGEDCPNGYINSLYHAFLRGVTELGCISLPPYEKNRSLIDDGGGLHVMLPAARVRVDRAELVRKGGAATGLLLYCSGRPLILKLLTSYSVNTRSMKKILEVGLPVIELDLSRDDAIDNAAVRDCLTSVPNNLGWVYNAKGEELWEALVARCSKLPVKERENKPFTYGCPVPAKRTDGFSCYVKESCARCEFFFGQYGCGEDRYVLCGRTALTADPEDLRLSLAERKKKYAGR